MLRVTKVSRELQNPSCELQNASCELQNASSLLKGKKMKNVSFHIKFSFFH